MNTALPGEVITFAGHRYQLVPGKLTWPQAKKKAEEMGGHLATITSKEENAFFRSTFGARLPNKKEITIGGSQKSADAPWQWVTGEPFDFTAWHTGAPHDATLRSANDVFPLGLCYDRKSDSSIGWYDTSQNFFTVSEGFLVEWDDDGTGKPAPAAR